jgi:hypothetical protein
MRTQLCLSKNEAMYVAPLRHDNGLDQFMTFATSTTIDNVLIPFDGRIESAPLLIHALEFSRSAKLLTLALLDGTLEQAAQGVISAMKMVSAWTSISCDAMPPTTFPMQSSISRTITTRK